MLRYLRVTRSCVRKPAQNGAVSGRIAARLPDTRFGAFMLQEWRLCSCQGCLRQRSRQACSQI
jgi:hypothetical protein